MINIKTIKKYADPDCTICESGGVVVLADGEEEECLCVVVRRNEIREELEADNTD